MKRIIIAMCALTVFAACKKDLEEKPYSSLAASNVFSGEDGVNKATLGIYQAYAINPFTDFYTWIISEVGQRYNTFGQTANTFIDPYQKFVITPTTGGLAEQWAQMYTIISRANLVIDNANGAMSANLATRYIAEAKFLRGYAHFMLTRWFGDIPIVNSSVSSLAQTDAIYGVRKPVAEVYDSIVADMQFAEANLPAVWPNSADIGRITAGVAKAGLGKVYLTMAGKPLEKSEYFQKAVDELSQLVGPGEATYNFALLDHFPDVFALGNERGPEMILTFSHFFSSISGIGSIIPFWFGPNGLNGPAQDFIGYTNSMYLLYEPSDERRDFTLPYRYKTNVPGDNGDSIVYDPTYPGYWDIDADKPYALQRSGIGYGKYAREPLGVLPWAYNSDLVYIRFSDVLLMLAEALNETGNSAEGLTHLNRIRVRANVSILSSTDQGELRAAIRKERLLELTGEFTTVFDIRRWGTLKDEIAAMSPEQVFAKDLAPYDPKLEVYPIPQTELDANQYLIQNPGY